MIEQLKQVLVLQELMGSSSEGEDVDSNDIHISDDNDDTTLQLKFFFLNFRGLGGSNLGENKLDMIGQHLFLKFM
jgi:hypothetical protein